MYDRVVVGEGVSLPTFPHKKEGIEWQTKTIGYPLLDKYRITENGRLLKQQAIFETVEEEDDDSVHPFPFVVKEAEWEEHKMHGSFTFYNSVEGEWWEFEARFTDGELEKIVLIDNYKL